jgi:Chromo (CHRromatin Organisation MOdifier) domain
MMIEQYIVERIDNHKLFSWMDSTYSKVELRIKWENYSCLDNTWEPLSNMLQDVPDMVTKYFSEIGL